MTELLRNSLLSRSQWQAQADVWYSDQSRSEVGSEKSENDIIEELKSFHVSLENIELNDGAASASAGKEGDEIQHENTLRKEEVKSHNESLQNVEPNEGTA